MIEIITFTIIIISINLILKKTNFLPNYSGQYHQTFTAKKNIPLSGGIFIFLIIAYLLPNEKFFLLLAFTIFFIGFMGDKNYLVSPSKRILLQILLVLFSVFLLDLLISSSRLDWFDKLLENKFFSFFFITFCILVLINGSNFIDGLNGLLIGYFILVIFIFYKINLLDQLITSNDKITFLFLSLLILLFLNYFNFFFLGDSGSYLVGITLSYISINIYNLNETIISPYFIILLLWYPCFENLFSIIRKKKRNLSPMEADNKHLHQILFFYIKGKKIINENYINSFTSFIINLFNLFLFLFSSIYPNNTKHQILCLSIAVLTYISIYFFLGKKN